jgi:hypothetical protein
VSDLTDWEWLKGEVMKWGIRRERAATNMMVVINKNLGVKLDVFIINDSYILYPQIYKKSFLKKVSITTFINMLFTLPFVILFSTPDFSGFQHASQFLFSIFKIFFLLTL